MVLVELVSPEGFRLDGRYNKENREISIQFGSPCMGQATFQLGNTIVRATVKGAREAKKNLQDADKAIVIVDYRIASFATSEDQRKKIKESRNAVEFSSWMEQVFNQIIVLTSYPRSQIEITISVLANDGSHVACAINAATLALIDAGIEMRDMVTATTVGYLQQHACIDLNKREEFGNPSVLVCTLGSDPSKFVLVESDSKLSIEKMDTLLQLAIVGCDNVLQSLRRAMIQRVTNVLSKRP